jgi:hypothetical protein
MTGRITAKDTKCMYNLSIQRLFSTSLAPVNIYRVMLVLKHMGVFMWSVDSPYSILTQSGVCRQILVKLHSIHEHYFSDSWVVTCGWKTGGRPDEANIGVFANFVTNAHEKGQEPLDMTVPNHDSQMEAWFFANLLDDNVTCQSAVQYTWPLLVRLDSLTRFLRHWFSTMLSQFKSWSDCHFHNTVYEIIDTTQKEIFHHQINAIVTNPPLENCLIEVFGHHVVFE